MASSPVTQRLDSREKQKAKSVWARCKHSFGGSIDKRTSKPMDLITSAIFSNSGTVPVFVVDFPRSSSSTVEKGAKSRLPYSPSAIHDNDNEGMDPPILEPIFRRLLSTVSQIIWRTASITVLLEAAILSPLAPFQCRILRRCISNL